MKKFTFLFIAYVFPPIPYAGTYRTMRLCNGLAEKGHTVHVVTIRPGKGIHQDPSLVEQLHRNVIVHRTRTVDPWLSYRENILPRPKLRFFRPVAGRLVTWISTPDHMVCWVPFAIRKARHLLRDIEVDVLYTTSPPHSEQMIGVYLKRKHGIPWIADLRDPITGNIVYDYQKIPWRQRVMEARLERSIVRNADAVLVNTEHARKVLQDQYPDCPKFATLRNFYDPREFEQDLPLYDEFTISHLGSIYAHRNPEVLFDAVSRLVRSPEGKTLQIRLNFVGLNDRRIGELVERYRLSEYVTIQDMVSHKKALEIMKRSHLLLVLKGFGEKGYGQIPGKLYEYVGSGNRILCIGPRQSECARIVEELGGGSTVEDDAEALLEVLKKECAFHGRKGASEDRGGMEIKRQAYCMDRAVERFLEVAGEITAGRRDCF